MGFSSKSQGCTLRIKFGGKKEEIKPHWLPVVFELLPKTGHKPLRFIVEDFERDLVDEADKEGCYFEIQDLHKGSYAFSIKDFHKGQTIIHVPDFELKGDIVEYEYSRREKTKLPNTFAMDFIVDAPYRLEKSYPYLPVVVYLKDIAPGALKIKSVEFYNINPSGGGSYDRLPPQSIYRVIDNNGNEVEENGQPTPLRFDPGEDFETVTIDPWYRLILLHKERFRVLQGEQLGYTKIPHLQYMVNVRYQRIFNKSKQFTFRTFVPESDLPRIDDWYYGDTHYHSDYTNNPYEYGGPLRVTAEVAKAVGLSWVTVTDHSYGLSRPKTQEEENQGNRWVTYKKGIEETNRLYEDFLLVGAEEITVRRYLSGLHVLSFGNPFIEDQHPLGFGSLTIEETFEKIRENSTGNKGFLYAAHPASGGYTWASEDYQTATNPEYGHLFAGLQIFNEKILYKRTTDSSMDREVLNPFEMFEKTDKQQPWSKELEEGVKRHWVEHFLLPPLRQFRKKEDLRKYYILAGSDAHMDFNYAFRPHPAFLIHYLNDNAFGKARTLAYLPKQNGRNLTEENLFEALRTGKTLLTDGPIVLFSLRPEGSEKIYRFGDTVLLPKVKNLELLLEWHSTEEFGPIEKIGVYLGTKKGELDISDQIDFSCLRNDRNGFQGRITHMFSPWTESPSYLRMQAVSSIDPKTVEGLFRCLTNPIWVITE